MSFHKKDWLLMLGGLAASMTGAGMFGLGPLAAMLGTEGAAGAAAGGAAAEGAGALAGTDAAAGAGGSLTGSGLFSQVPGVSAGSQQAAMLAAQNEGLGGMAAQKTAEAAMPAVKAAYASGQMGLPDYLAQGAKLQFAGLNDPSVLASRAMTNLGGMAKPAATNMALRALAPQPPGYQPSPVSMSRQPMPDLSAHAPDEDINTLLQRARAGDPVAAQKLRQLMQGAV